MFRWGTAGIDAVTGAPDAGIEAQTELAFRNLDAILTAAGASFAAMNAVYERFTPDLPPARSAPANVRSPRRLLIAIDAVAVVSAT